MSVALRHRWRRRLRAAAIPLLAWKSKLWTRGTAWTIFAGHEVGDSNPHLDATMRISVSALEERLHYAQHLGRIVTVREGLSLLARDELRRPLLSFSFDDGYRGVLEHAAPLLRRMGLRATLFVHTGTWDGTWLPWTDRFFLLQAHLGTKTLAERMDAALGTPGSFQVAGAQSLYELKSQLHRHRDPAARDAALATLFESELGATAPWAARIYIRPEELRGIEDVFELASHGVLHRRAALLDAAEQRQEIEGALQALHGALGHAVEGFAYPFGRESDLPRGDSALLLHSGHAYACTMIEGTNLSGADPYRLQRWPLEERAARAELAALVRGGLTARWLRR